MLRWLSIGQLLLPLGGMSEVLYRLHWAGEAPFTYRVLIQFPSTKGSYTDLRMPAWRPGRYILQNYAGGVYDFSARTAQGSPLFWKKSDKDTWRIFHKYGSIIEVEYRLDARALDAGSSYQGGDLIYFNPVTLFMHIVGRLDEKCLLALPDLSATWSVATALPLRTPGLYEAASYHHLVDAPFVIAPTLRQAKKTCLQATLHVHFWGEVGAQNLEGFLDDLCKIVQAQTAIWGELPLSDYHFIYILVPFQMRHAVEHEYCAVFVLPQSGAQDETGLKSFLGISAHEFFHVWNVKRLRPAAMWPYDYNRPPATALHWLTEGVTDYYTSLSLARAGLLSESEFWQNLSSFLTQLENSWTYRQFSPAELSIDSWHATSPYRPAFLQGSFYAAGRRVGFLLDMFLRRESGGKVTLDSLMRHLYETYYKKGRGLPEEGVEKAVLQLLGKNKAEKVKTFWQSYVYGRERMAYKAFLAGLPLEVVESDELARGWARIGILRWRKEGEGIQIEEVEPQSAAALAGLQRGDVLYTIGEKPAIEIEPSFWDRLSPNETISLGLRHEGEVMEGTLRLNTQKLSVQKTLRLTPVRPGFLTRD